jgi:hypothetical protein
MQFRNDGQVLRGIAVLLVARGQAECKGARANVRDRSNLVAWCVIERIANAAVCIVMK